MKQSNENRMGCPKSIKLSCDKHVTTRCDKHWNERVAKRDKLSKREREIG